MIAMPSSKSSLLIYRQLGQTSKSPLLIYRQLGHTSAVGSILFRFRYTFSSRRPQSTLNVPTSRTTRRPFSYPNHLRANLPSSTRTIFIQTESTPNVDALKFLPNHPILPPELSSTFLEYLSPRSTLAPPHPSPLASRLLNIDGVSSVFYGSNFITITKCPDSNWAHVKPEVFSLITEAVTSGEPIVKTIADRPNPPDGEGAFQDSLTSSDDDTETVSLIKELLETRIRPSIQDDGGDIEFRGFIDGKVLLKLRGACRTCDSSTVTLKNGIESMLMHYIEEVQGVVQVLDQEEEIAVKEFAKFEEKLKELRGSRVGESNNGQETADTSR